MEYFIHGTLEGGRGIGWSKGHAFPFKMAIGGDKGRLFYCFVGHSNLVVSHEQVKSQEVTNMGRHVFEDVADSRDWVGIELGDLVELMIVHTHARCNSSFSIFLGDKDNR
jgi:hypothetical protein